MRVHHFLQNQLRAPCSGSGVDKPAGWETRAESIFCNISRTGLRSVCLSFKLVRWRCVLKTQVNWQGQDAPGSLATGRTGTPHRQAAQTRKCSSRQHHTGKAFVAAYHALRTPKANGHQKSIPANRKNPIISILRSSRTVQEIGGTPVECVIAYDGNRETPKKPATFKKHGYADLAPTAS